MAARMKDALLSIAGIIISVLSFVTILEAKTVKSEGLNSKQEKIIPIAAFTANGDMGKLKTALHEGLDAGLTINEIKEILVQMYAYAGFPRSLNGINTFMSVLDERRTKGISDEVGKEASPTPGDMNRDEYGAKVRAMLAGQEVIPPPGGYQLFTPVIDKFLKEHLFADIFSRDTLDHRNRELATISALASMTGTAGQLRFHLAAAMNTGLTEAQMTDFISVLKSKVGVKEAANANEILAAVLADRRGREQSTPGVSTHTKKEEDNMKTISISRSGSQPPVKGPSDWFTGTVRIDPLFKENDPLHASGGRVKFEPGARTAWHNHPYGQILIVTDGTGLVQQWGQPIEEIREGDVVRIPPGVKHWHGATASTALTHIAIQEPLNNQAAEWMEHVSADQYKNGSGLNKKDKP